MCRLLRSVTLAPLLVPGVAQAWSYKEHILFARLAAIRLLGDPTTPDAMKQWLRQSVPDMGDMAIAREFFMTGTVGMDPLCITGISRFAVKPDEHSRGPGGAATHRRLRDRRRENALHRSGVFPHRGPEARIPRRPLRASEDHDIPRHEGPARSPGPAIFRCGCHRFTTSLSSRFAPVVWVTPISKSTTSPTTPSGGPASCALSCRQHATAAFDRGLPQLKLLPAP